jgi:hypothetical protein
MRTLLLAAAAALLVAACSSQATDPGATAANIDVIVTTTGAHPDTSGYTLTIAGYSPYHLATNDSLQLTGIPFGDRQFTFSDVDTNCTVQGGLSQSQYLPVGYSKHSFSFTCN